MHTIKSCLSSSIADRVIHTQTESTRRSLASYLIALLALLLTALPNLSLAQPKIGEMVSNQVLGSADDSDATTPPARYNAPKSYSAKDGSTNASSGKPTVNSVSGSAAAQAPVGAKNTDDPATAKSFNKVISELTVENAGAVTFKTKLDMKNIVVRHQGNVRIEIKASIVIRRYPESQSTTRNADSVDHAGPTYACMPTVYFDFTEWNTDRVFH